MEVNCRECNKSFAPFRNEVNCPSCREANAEKARTSRAKKEKLLPTDYQDWILTWDEEHPTEYKQLADFTEKFRTKVSEELGAPLGYTEPHDMVSEVGTIFFCMDKKFPFVRDVYAPHGTVYGGTWADICAERWEYFTKQHNLEASPTYSDHYRKTLLWLDKKFGKTNSTDKQVRESALACRRECQRLGIK